MKETLTRFTIHFLSWINDATHNNLAGFISTTKIGLVLTPFVFIWKKITNWSWANIMNNLNFKTNVL